MVSGTMKQVIVGFVLAFFFCGLVCAESLVSKRSHLYEPQDGEKELVSQRTRGFKKYKTGSRQYRVSGQIGPIHYRLDPFSEAEQYKEIDLDVLFTPGEAWDAACETNGYQVRFWNSRNIGGKTVSCIAQFRRAGKWVTIAPLALVWENDIGQRQLISKPQAGIIPVIDNSLYRVSWNNVFGSGLHYRYNLWPDEFFKTVIIDGKTDLPVPTIGLVGLKLSIILGISWHRNSELANGFADEITPGELPNDTDESNIDEELVDSGKLPFRDELLRDVFCLQRPRAWDSAEPRHNVDLEWRLRRRGNFVFLALSAMAVDLDNVNVVYPVYMDTDITEEDISGNPDDGWHRGLPTPIYNRTGTWAIVGRIDVTSYAHSANFRFQTIPIPQAAVITAATLTVTARTSEAGADVQSVIEMEDRDTAPFIDDAAHFATSIVNVTTASVAWNGVPAFVDGTEYTSPDFTAVLKEVVDRGNWNSGQDIMVLWHDNDDNTSPNDGNSRWASTREHAVGEVAHFNASYGVPSQVIRVISH